MSIHLFDTYTRSKVNAAPLLNSNRTPHDDRTHSLPYSLPNIYSLLLSASPLSLYLHMPSIAQSIIMFPGWACLSPPSSFQSVSSLYHRTQHAGIPPPACVAVVVRKWYSSYSPTCHLLPATCHLPPATCHPPPATCHPPPANYLPSPATHHPPPITHHPPPATCHIPHTALQILLTTCPRPHYSRCLVDATPKVSGSIKHEFSWAHIAWSDSKCIVSWEYSWERGTE